MTININCWNEYDTLKTVILGNVFQEHIPIMYKDDPIQQDAFAKIVEETIEDLNEIQKVLEQNNVQVLRPSQPKDYNMSVSQHIESHSPLINMRDFHMAYGNMFFMTYGSFYLRRFHHLWIEDIVNQMIDDGNLVISANEPNLRSFDASYRMKGVEQWELAYRDTYDKKNLIHTACILRYGKTAFINELSGSAIGKKWMGNWLAQQKIKLFEISNGFGHLDGTNSILNKDTILSTNPGDKHWAFFKNKLTVPLENIEEYERLRTSQDIIKNPSRWLKEWQGYIQSFRYELNTFSLSPDKVLLSFYDKEFYKQLANCGIEGIYVKWSHRMFWSGGLHCITCDLHRES